MGFFIRLAKEYSSNAEQNFNTNTVSTLEYMSPETFKNSVYLIESDVFSFGVLLYELFAEKDFTTFTGYQHIEAITHKKFRPSLDNVPDEPGLRSVIEKAWDDNFRNRPNMLEICQTLQHIRANKDQANF